MALNAWDLARAQDAATLDVAPQTVSVGVPTSVTGTDGRRRLQDVPTAVAGCTILPASSTWQGLLPEGGERLANTHRLFGPASSAFAVGRIVTDAASERYRIQDVDDWPTHTECGLLVLLPGAA